MRLSFSLHALLSSAAVARPWDLQNRPTVTIKNGTVIGTSDPLFNVESFLGIPYAQPPIGDLRFDLPKPVAIRWETPQDATNYGYHCLGRSLALEGFKQERLQYTTAEDCLTINIARPAGVPEKARLPVLVWIHGGAFEDGGSSDPRYNLTSLVANSMALAMPTIVVSMNYRLSGWSYLTNNNLMQSGLGNFGIHDQRMALSWIQENIASFGGDPGLVTVAGESAGAMSVGYHLLTYADDAARPFRAAVAQSGGPLVPPSAPKLADVDALYPSILNATGCSSAQDGLACLRSAPADNLTAFFAQYRWFPIPDGRTVPTNPALALEAGNFSDVPLLIGSNTNEGTSFYRLFGIGVNNTAQYGALIEAYSGANPFPNKTFHDLVAQYTALNLSAELGSVNPTIEPSLGSEYGRASVFLGDYLFTAGRRVTSQSWARRGLPAYSYRFNTIPSGVPPHILGAAHFQDVAFVFGDTSGTGWDHDPFDVQPLERRQRYGNLATVMSRMWISFANTLSPNYHGVPDFGEIWPAYSIAAPMNMVFDGNTTSHLERDDWRADAINTMRESAPGWW